METAVNGSRLVVLRLGIGLHIIESLRGGQRLNSWARISLVLSSRLLYLHQCGECMGTGKGMETSETLSLNDSWYRPGRERGIKYWQGLCVLKWWRRNVHVRLCFSLHCVKCVFVLNVYTFVLYLVCILCLHARHSWWHQICGYLSFPFLARAWWVVEYLISAGGAEFSWAGAVWF